MKKLLLVCCLIALTSQAQAYDRPPQFVQVAFDGSYRLEAWEKTRELAREASTVERPVRFTYFINSVYLLHVKFRKVYVPPVGKPGTAALEFPDNLQEIQSRIDQMNLAMQEGNEIASHAAGHFIGNKWTEAQWEQEFSEFNKLLFHYQENNQLDPATAPVLNLKPEDIVGFRAPGLGTSPGLFTTLKKHNFRYDTSRTGKPDYWPQKIDGLWNFPLALIPMAGTNPTKWSYSMDYNFFQADTGLVEVSKLLTTEDGRARMLKNYGTDKEAEILKLIEDRTYQTLWNYFEKNYKGNRAPVHIGFHFAPYQESAYFTALKRFVLDVSKLPEVKLTNYSDLANYMDGLTTDQIAAYQKATFTKMP